MQRYSRLFLPTSPTSYLPHLPPTYLTYLLPTSPTSYLPHLPPTYLTNLLPTSPTSYLPHLPPTYLTYLLPTSPTSYLPHLPPTHSSCSRSSLRPTLLGIRQKTQPLFSPLKEELTMSSHTMLKGNDKI